MSLARPAALEPQTRSDSRAHTVDEFRPEIEGLRAVAALLVASFHIWADRISGGVDVFFAISGFLITLTLLRNTQRHGRLRLRTYFSRLALRLLPASLLVLFVTITVVMIIYPAGRRTALFEQWAASAGWVQNWYLAANAVDYLGTDQDRSPFQQFWAMSVQGQFYVLWAIIVVIAALIAARLGAALSRVVIIIVIIASAISFVVSIVQTATIQEFAYFSTATRVWEFGAGSLLALTIGRLSRAPWLALLGWVGLGMVVLTGALFPVGELFPGYAALWPVVGALFVVIGGQAQSRWSLRRVLGSRPLVRLGGLAFGIYLWHWPLFVFAGVVLERTSFGIFSGGAIIVASVIAAWVTNLIIEQPVQRWARSGERSFAGPLAAVLAGVAIASITTGLVMANLDRTEQQRQAAELQAALSVGGSCWGAALLDPDRPECADVDGTASSVIVDTSTDYSVIERPECHTGSYGTEFRPCTFGVEGSDTRVALIGNSHAAVWFSPLLAIAESEGWQLDVFYKSACTFSTTVRQTEDPARSASCAEWNRTLMQHLADGEPYDWMLTSANSRSGRFIGPDGETGREFGVEPYREAWAQLTSRGTTVIALRDYPFATAEAIACAGRATATFELCTTPRSDAEYSPDKEVLMMAAEGAEGVVIADMNDWFCREDQCSAFIGGVQVYRNTTHFTDSYARTLTPYFWRELHEVADFPAPPATLTLP